MRTGRAVSGFAVAVAMAAVLLAPCDASAQSTVILRSGAAQGAARQDTLDRKVETVIRFQLSGRTDSSAVLPRRRELLLIMENARTIQLISRELDRFVRSFSSDSLDGTWAKRYAPAIKSLQGHATIAVHNIEQICSPPEPGRRAYMGVELEVFDVRVSPSRASAAAPYPRVVRVERTSPAERAGIEAGDVIVKINGVDMRGRDPGDFITKPGAALDLHVDSEGRSREVHVELAPPPAWEWGRTGFPPACQMGLNPSDVFMLLHHDSLAASALNIPAIRGRVEPSARSLAFRTLSTDSSGQRLSGAGGSAVFSGTTVFAAQPMTLTFFGAAFRSASLSFLQKEGARNGGVPVMFVTHNSAAARAGLEAGDIVLRVGRQPVKSMTDLQSAMQKMAGAEPVELEVLRNQKLEKVSIKLQ